MRTSAESRQPVSSRRSEPRSRRGRTRSRRLLLPLGVLAFFSMGAADGCLGINDVGLKSEVLSHNDAKAVDWTYESCTWNLDSPLSPDAKNATPTNPVLVTRDNPWFGGALDIQGSDVSGGANHAFSADGTWTNFSGKVTLKEYGTNGLLLNTYIGPILPTPDGFKGPGQATWQSRFGRLVPGRRYEATLDATAGSQQQHIESDQTLHLKLADQIHVVPIVVINWKEVSKPNAYDVTRDVLAQIDLIPYHEPNWIAPQLTPAGVLEPNQQEMISHPEPYSRLTDEVFAQCGVQFQVIATFEMTLPANYVNGTAPFCNDSGFNFASRSDIKANIAQALGNQAVADLIDQINPIYVSYGPMDCGPNMRGHYVTSESLIEIDQGHWVYTTAHELGHALLGTKHTDNDPNFPDNLMKSAVGASNKQLTCGQCLQARDAARVRSERYADAMRENEPSLYDPEEELSGVVIDSWDDQVCCQIGDSPTYEFTTEQECIFVLGNKKVDEELCDPTVCCLTRELGDVDTMPTSSCELAGGTVESMEQCELHCCTAVRTNEMVTAYTCEALGGTPVECELEEPK